MILKTTYMRNYVTTYILFATLLLEAACKKNAQDPAYKGAASLLIGGDGTMIPADSAFVFSFAIYPSSKHQDTLGLMVQTIGNIEQKDRVFNIVVDTSSTAKPGEYILPASFVMPAGQFKINFPLIINRVARLKDSTAYLLLRIVANEEFQPGPYFGGTGYLGPVARVRWTDLLTKPADWDVVSTNGRMLGQVGKWSRVKHQLIIDATGYAVFSTTTAQEKYYIASKAKQYLTELNAATGVPLKNEDGVVIDICNQCN
jgi:hypothetical protein